MNNEQIVLAKRPQGIPQDDVFRFESIDVSAPKEGEVQVLSIYVSVDPYMRGRMNDTKSYVAPYEIDAPLQGHIVGKVIKSNHESFEEGDYVTGILPWKKVNTISGDQLTVVPSQDVPLYLYLSILGMPGMTAYTGLLQIGKPKAGETVVVSAASGAVGSVVGQIAKIKGARVVGIAGGEKKTSYLIDELGFDAAIDYKQDDFAQQLAAAVPEGIDVYFENVGGAISDEVFKHLNKFARIPVCGAISIYNNQAQDIGLRIQGPLVKSQALMQGFVVAQFADYFKEASEQLAQWVSQGKIKSEVTIDEGFDHLPSAFRKLFTGENFGKQVVKVAEA
ncbi:NADP-dependent oxidoreductase [Staphylococcus sp. 17KM0847]|uniref:NADP-dependent oxidoreductase n=1 Tax=Staphylococcus sp. 17KM0847 TaxID=2583989 RepID=UPI0015DBD7E0|nr:NADP-dependent oxidoreductase [Staphylococcus sp. 17KM0847]QLK85246.1 NADP-dependent oxidoreductase [Staphylococcus sp. 17KM0847]